MDAFIAERHSEAVRDEGEFNDEPPPLPPESVARAAKKPERKVARKRPRRLGAARLPEKGARWRARARSHRSRRCNYGDRQFQRGRELVYPQ